MTELEYSNKICQHFSRYFDIEKEVWSVDGKSRIDLVLIDKTNIDIVFGVEIKRFESKRGEEIGKFIIQANRYAKSYFNVLGVKRKLPILLCPALSYNYLICSEHKLVHEDKEYFADRHDKDNEHHTINGILGCFLLGEVRKFCYVEYKTKNTKDYFRFVFSNKTLWSNQPEYNSTKPKGVHLVNYTKHIEKICK